MKRTLAAVLAMVMVLDLGVGQAHVYAQDRSGRNRDAGNEES